MNNNKQTSQEVMLSIQGMNCAACATRIEKVLSKDESIEHVTVSYPMRTAWINVNENVRMPLSPQLYIDKIKKLGFHAKLMTSIIEDMQQEKRKLGWRLIVSLIFTVPLLIPMLLHIPFLNGLLQFVPSFMYSLYTQLICATVIQFLIATPFYINAFYAIREKVANMDVLVVIGTSAAYIYSHYELFQYQFKELLQLPLHIIEGLYFETTGVVISAVLIGKYIELKTAIKLQRENQHYIKENNQPITIFKNEQLISVNPYIVEKDDLVVLQKGDVIGIDGHIVQGKGYVEESFLSGESGWIEKQQDDKVWAGSSVCEGEFIVQTDSTYFNTRLASIKQLIKVGHVHKSKLQTQLDSVINWFVPFIILLAIVALLFYFIVPNAHERIIAAIAVLLVACPCAIGLATPISMSLASSYFLKQGLIVRDNQAIERLAKVNQIVFDKTGTLTRGELVVSFFHSWKGSRIQLLHYLTALEQPLEHPIAEAIKRYTRREKLDIPNVQFWQHYIGMGVGGYINKKHIVVGNERLLQHLHLELNFTAKRIADSRLELGETMLFIFEERQLIGLIGLKDKVNERIRDVISQLEKYGIQSIMATGDHPLPAKKVASKLGIKHIYSKLLPEQKMKLITDLKQHKIVAMVGDGINDAPAIATSDVGIALSHGSKETLEVGHMTLLYGNLMTIPKAIKASQLTVRNIKQNIGFAFGYNILMLPLAVAGYLQPWMAGIAMALSSIMVVSNAFRLHLQLNKTSV